MENGSDELCFLQRKTRDGERPVGNLTEPSFKDSASEGEIGVGHGFCFEGDEASPRPTGYQVDRCGSQTESHPAIETSVTRLPGHEFTSCARTKNPHATTPNKNGRRRVQH